MLDDVIEGVDLFLGLFGLNVLRFVMVEKMDECLIIFVLVNLMFEIMLDVVCKVVFDVIIVMGCSDFFN